MEAYHDGDLLATTADLPRAWPTGLFIRNIRRIFSPTPELYWIEDDVELTEPLAMSFLLHTGFPVVIDGDFACVHGKESWLWVVPIHWQPSARCDALGTDSHLQPVQVLRMTSPQAAIHRLRTLLVITKPECLCPVSYEGFSPVAAGYTMTVNIDGGQTRLSFAGPTDRGEIIFKADGTISPE